MPAKLVLGLVLGSSLVKILDQFPAGVIWVLLLFAGIKLAMCSRDIWEQILFTIRIRILEFRVELSFERLDPTSNGRNFKYVVAKLAEKLGSHCCCRAARQPQCGCRAIRPAWQPHVVVVGDQIVVAVIV
ncbi:molybdate transporter 1-like [Forsythia ovata]|uniref:Molybdate transporter 1-like n=1 Tax=Forsythia ovata TaxID=205694 RepID=A0ABD1NVX7_9LAMI